MNIKQYEVGEYFSYPVKLETGKTLYHVGLKVAYQYMIPVGLYFMDEKAAKENAQKRNTQNATN